MSEDTKESKPAAKRSASKKPAAADETNAPDPSQSSADAPDVRISPGTTTTHKDVARQREEQLAAGKVTGQAKTAANRLRDASPIEQRAGHLGARVADGRVDNMSRRDDSDALFGHFCVIDFGHDEFGKDAKKAVEAVIGEGNAHAGSGDYGVFVDIGEADEHGYPITATVMLRDEHSAQVPGIPYGALRPVDQASRR
jgi:hypothetical protein